MTNIFSLTAGMDGLEGGKLPPVDQWDPPYCGEMDMVIQRDGVWFHEGTPIGRPKLVRLFASILKREGDDFFLITPVEKVKITVIDSPFIATIMDVMGADETQNITFKTNVGDVVDLNKQHPLVFRDDPENKESGKVPYLMVRAGLEARLARPVYYALAELAQPDNNYTEYVIHSQGQQFTFPFGTASS